MFFSEELQNKIKILLKDDDELREKLLLCDVDAIREIGRISQRRIESKDIVTAFESNEPLAINNLYNQAKWLCDLNKLYIELCMEYSKYASDIQKGTDTNSKKK